MPKLIEDTFADLPISRQRRYQLRKKVQGKCAICGSPSRHFYLCGTCFKVIHIQRGHKRFNVSSRVKGTRAKPKRVIPRGAVVPKIRKEPKNPWLIKEKSESQQKNKGLE